LSSVIIFIKKNMISILLEEARTKVKDEMGTTV
jgi:hypothetical protein